MTQSPQTPELPKWKVARKKRHLITSASQHETATLCFRKWWLGRVRKLESPSTTSQVFGTVLHAVAERYLRADDLGRDPETGKPVDLYPEGWEQAWERDRKTKELYLAGEATPAEQTLIKSLIEAGIENGLLERLPGREIEHSFRESVMQADCPECNGTGLDVQSAFVNTKIKCRACGGDGKGDHVEMMGFIDALYPDAIHDHKTAKNFKYSKNANHKSPNYLGKNLQVLVYAKLALDKLRKEGKPLPEKFHLRHNIFCKNPQHPTVRKVDVAVTPEQVEDHWNRVILPQTEEMIRLRRTAEKWSDIPDPPTGNRACNAYGGCEYMTICSGMETEENYESRLARQSKSRYVGVSVNETSGGNQSPTTKGTNTMSFKDKLAKMKARQGTLKGGGSGEDIQPSTPEPTKAEEPAKPKGVEQAEAAQEQEAAPAKSEQQAAPSGDSQTPPWAVPGCVACKGVGFNSKGNPCGICNVKSKQSGDVTSQEFTTRPIGGGKVQWQHRQDDTIVGQTVVPGLADAEGNVPEVKAQERAEKPQEAQPEQTAPEPAPEAEAPQTAPEPAAGPPRLETKDEQAKAAQTTEKPAKAPAKDKGGDEPAVPTIDEPVSRPRGRPAKGFTLLINCGVVKGAGKLQYAEEVLARYGEAMAKEAEESSFYQINAFHRRDALAGAAKVIAEDIGNDTLVVTGLGSGMSDMKALIDALKPYAGTIIQGVEG